MLGTPDLAKLLTFWLCGLEVSVSQSPELPTHSFHLPGAAALLGCRVVAVTVCVSESISHVCVCVKQGVLMAAHLGTDPGCLTLRRWRRGLCQLGGHSTASAEVSGAHTHMPRSRRHTHTPRAMHIVDVSLSRSHTNTRRLPFCLFSVVFALTYKHKQWALEYCFALSLSLSLPWSWQKTPQWSQKSSCEKNYREAAQTGNSWQTTRK